MGMGTTAYQIDSINYNQQLIFKWLENWAMLSVPISQSLWTMEVGNIRDFYKDKIR